MNSILIIWSLSRFPLSELLWESIKMLKNKMMIQKRKNIIKEKMRCFRDKMKNLVSKTDNNHLLTRIHRTSEDKEKFTCRHSMRRGPQDSRLLNNRRRGLRKSLSIWGFKEKTFSMDFHPPHKETGSHRMKQLLTWRILTCV